MAKIKITLTKSPIGYNKNQKAVLVSLGLRKLNSSVVQEDTPDILGKTHKVAHLVKVEAFEEAK
jgi:large subunit ribosomal protein L30